MNDNLNRLTTLTETGRNVLRKKYPEGIPTWMIDRDLSFAEIVRLMNLRREAFPKTAK